MNKIITVALLALIFSCVLVSSLPMDAEIEEVDPKILQKRCEGIGCFFVNVLGFPDIVNRDGTLRLGGK
jgi:hypothetical protein